MTDPISDQQYIELLGTNPRAVAAPDSPARLEQWQAAQALESRLESALSSVTPPEGLQDRLLALADLQDESGVATAPISPAYSAANDPLFWQRLLPTAALLLLALGIGWYFQIDRNLELQDDLFGHLYAEEPWYPLDSHYQLADVNAHLEASLGAHINENAGTEKLDVTFVKDCLVAKQVGTHLVMQGSMGPVNVIVLPESVVDTETLINDDRFSGLVTPAFGRTLVIIGNKQEPIAEYRNLINASLDWEY